MKFARLLLRSLLILSLVCFCLYELMAFSSITPFRIRKGLANRLSGSYNPPAPYGSAELIGTITDSGLSEVSGITPSRTAKGLWWVHNDSGDGPKLYVIDSGGKRLAKFIITGARNYDWEDIAGYAGKDGKAMLAIGDIGNNGLRRESGTIYRIKEPDISKGAIDGVTETAEVLQFRYPDGRHDAEALIVDPKTGRPYIITKTLAPPGGVYRFPMPLRPGEKVTLEKVEGKGADYISRLLMVTGASASPDGQRVTVRTYFGAIELRRRPGGAFETAFDSNPDSIKLPLERQGEAISYTADGRSIVITSERVPAPIYKLDRK